METTTHEKWNNWRLGQHNQSKRKSRLFIE